MTDAERAEWYALLAADPRLFIPTPGPQQEAMDSDADITGYGGAAGGGKSMLITGLATHAHKRSLIIRQEKNTTRKFVQDIAKMLGTRDGYSSQTSSWAMHVNGSNRIVEFAGLENEGDEEKQQGVDYDLKCYDEATQMREAQVRYTMGWVRSDDPKQRCRVILTFNPPTTAEGRWVIKFFAPWLDPKHPNPAKDGELRWFSTIGDNPDFELDRPDDFVVVNGLPVYEFDPRDHKSEDIISPKSRTFITARVTDNPYYMQTGYMKQLQALPEPLRSQMLRGDFGAGVEDDANQLIPTAWIEASMDRWTEKTSNPQFRKGVMDSMGVDAARGGNMGSTQNATGKDKMVIARRHGRYVDRLVSIKGLDVNSGSLAAAQVIRYRTDSAVVHIDIIGVGTSPHDFLTDNHIQTVAVNGAAHSNGTDKSGLLRFANLRAELHWQLREALDPANPDCIDLPDDSELLADLAAPTYRLTSRGIQVESKEEIVKRIKRSPDKGDAVVYSLIDTPKRQMLVGGLKGVSGVAQRYEDARLRELES